MDEIIAKSKFHKHERQQQKADDENLRNEVDNELDSIRQLIQGGDQSLSSSSSSESKKPQRTPLDPDPYSTFQKEQTMKETADYDKLIKELAFEKRARPTNRTKTEEELALEEKENLERLERERFKRMSGIEESDDEDGNGNRGSGKKRVREAIADDLDPDYAIDTNYGNTNDDSDDGDDEEHDTDHDINDGQGKKSSLQGYDKPLTYQDGKLVNDTIFIKKRKRISDNDDNEADHDGSGLESYSASDDEEEDDDVEVENEEEDKDEENKETDEDEDEGDIVSLNESMSENESFTENDENEENNNNSKEGKPVHSTSSSKDEKVSVDTLKTDLPFTFPAPTSYEELMTLFANRTSEEQLIIIHRLRILYHIKLSPQNKVKLVTLFNLLNQYLDQITAESNVDMSLVNGLSKHIKQLAFQFPDKIGEWGFNIVKRLCKWLGQDTGVLKLPKGRDLTFIRLLGQIFPTSDKQHYVLTPLTLLMGQCLSQSIIGNGKQAASGLFLCNMFQEVRYYIILFFFFFCFCFEYSYFSFIFNFLFLHFT